MKLFWNQEDSRTKKPRNTVMFRGFLQMWMTWVVCGFDDDNTSSTQPQTA